MKKKNMLIANLLFLAILLGTLTLIGLFYKDKKAAYEFPYEVFIDEQTKVTWNITEELPNKLPVYSVTSAADLPEMWSNLLNFCGISENILFSRGTSFESENWTIHVKDSSEIICRCKTVSEAETITHAEYPVLIDRSFELIEELGMQPENYYISAYPVDSERRCRILDFSYKFDDYRAEEHPPVISISFEGEKVVEISIRFEEIREYGSIVPISLDVIKEKFDEFSFYTDSPALAQRNRVENLTVTGINVVYVREDALYVPYLTLNAEMFDEPMSAAIFTSLIKANTPNPTIVTGKDTSDVSDDIAESDTEIFIRNLYDEAMLSFRNRDFKSSLHLFGNVIRETAATDLDSVNIQIIENKAFVYLVLSDIQLGNHHPSEKLKAVQCFFDELALSDNTHADIDAQELTTLRIYTRLALAHLATVGGEMKETAEYLAQARELMEGGDHDKIVDIFYLYQKTWLSPVSADELYQVIDEWDEVTPDWIRKSASYYIPMLKIMAAKAYLEAAETDKVWDIIEHELMSQSAPLGTAPEEKMRILAETFSLTADYWETQDQEDNFNKILSCRQKAASLYESLMLVCFDGVNVDRLYYDQTGMAYYDIAALYTKAGQLNAALSNLERAFELFAETDPASCPEILDAYALGVTLYQQLDDHDNAEQCRKMLKFRQNDSAETNTEKRVVKPSSDREEILIVYTEYAAHGTYPKLGISSLILKENLPENTSLSQAIEKLSAEISIVTEQYKEKMALYNRHCIANGYSTSNHYMNTDLYITRYDDLIISVLLRVDTFTNGVHEYTTFHAFNYSFGEQKLLSESEITSTSICLKATEAMEQQYPEMLFIDKITPDNSDVILTPVGYTFIFNPGIAASYAEGSLSITVPYESSSAYVSPLSFSSEIAPYIPFASVDTSIMYTIYNYIEDTKFKGFRIEREGENIHIETAFTLSTLDRLFYVVASGKEYILVIDSSENITYCYSMESDGSITVTVRTS